MLTDDGLAFTTRLTKQSARSPQRSGKHNVFVYYKVMRASGELFPARQPVIVYYESRKRELKIRLMNEGRCDERLKARVEESTCLTYTGLHDKTN